MPISPEIWGPVVYAAVFISLILFPWTVGRIRLIFAVLGFGGLAAIVALDILVGMEKGELALAKDLALLDILKGVFFFLSSFLVERVFRIWMIRREQNKPPESYGDKIVRERFEREMRGVKTYDETAPKK